MSDNLPIVIAVCCKEWPVYAGIPWGRCGECGVLPVYVRRG